MRNIFRLRSVAGMRPLLILAALLFALTAAGVARPASASAADRFCSDAAIHPPFAFHGRKSSTWFPSCTWIWKYAHGLRPLR